MDNCSILQVMTNTSCNIGTEIVGGQKTLVVLMVVVVVVVVVVVLVVVVVWMELAFQQFVLILLQIYISQNISKTLYTVH